MLVGVFIATCYMYMVNKDEYITVMKSSSGGKLYAKIALENSIILYPLALSTRGEPDLSLICS